MADSVSLIDDVRAGRARAEVFPVASRVARMSASKTMAVTALADGMRESDCWAV